MLSLIVAYGAPAGLAIIVLNIVSLEYGRGQAWLGLLIMFIAFSTIYVATKQYRDKILGGVIGFKAALLVGLGISALAGVIYVAVWELYLAMTDFQFIDYYVATVIQDEQAAERFRQQYANPVQRLAITFLEVFPVGLLVSLGSAIALKNHKSAS